MTPADFEPRANFPSVRDSTLPEKWPISYEELRPFYERAESLFRVRGTADPLYPAGADHLRPPPVLAARDAHLFQSFQRLGLHPYRIHVAYEFAENCSGCVGRCRRECKNDAARVCLLPALRQFGATLLSECEVVRLEADSTRVHAIHCRWRGKTISIRAKAVILAAGAFMTPVLLLNSACAAWPHGLANGSGLVGRNLMFHASDLIAVMPLARLGNPGLQKTLALNDFYHAAGEKLGTFQTLGASVAVGRIMQYIRETAERDPAWWRRLASPHPMWWRKLSSPAIRLVALAMYHVLNFKNASVWASIIEDLPYHDNRVIADRQAPSGMSFHYRYPDELRRRAVRFRERVARALRPHRTFVLSGDNNLNFGHVCGTCRFGDDPARSVLDRYNRAHQLSNLYVVDASFFPSSGGTNPSLTIAANGLRVAAAVHAQLG
jgi:choline dehydrogenase-like flavoprotein